LKSRRTTDFLPRNFDPSGLRTRTEEISRSAPRARTNAVCVVGHHGKLAVVDFCIGGLLTLKYAARFHCDAAVSFYGVRVHEHQKELRSIESPLQYHVGGADTHILRDRINPIENVVNGMPNATVYTHQGAKHGFFNSLREEAFSREAFLAADQRMLELLMERL
jgi:carboxymethylenebutenolidase